jgi:hypothetical protein
MICLINAGIGKSFAHPSHGGKCVATYGTTNPRRRLLRQVPYPFYEFRFTASWDSFIYECRTKIMFIHFMNAVLRHVEIHSFYEWCFTACWDSFILWMMFYSMLRFIHFMNAKSLQVLSIQLMDAVLQLVSKTTRESQFEHFSP